MFAASLQLTLHIWACERLQQTYSKPNLHCKIIAANMQHTCRNLAAMNTSLLHDINVCSRHAAIIAGAMIAVNMQQVFAAS